MKMIKLRCTQCGGEFERSAVEARRNGKKGREVFCSRTCMGIHHNKNCSNTKRSGHCQIDEFSPFRKFMGSVKVRERENRGGRSLGYNITLQDLKDQWEAQDGVCPYTGWKLQLPATRTTWHPNTPHYLRASIDRIDSDVGYMKGNIQFCALMANTAKSNLLGEDLIKFCKAVAEFRKE